MWPPLWHSAPGTARVCRRTLPRVAAVSNGLEAWAQVLELGYEGPGLDEGKVS
jgi:hypothetical protein